MHAQMGLPIKILIVDDDKVTADILKDLISDKDRTVDVCYDGSDAIESIEKNVYDLVIVDLVMPKVGGLEVLKHAKKINPDVMVIIITGYASLETAIMAIKEGAYDYIRKPCKLEEMKIAVENAIEKIKLNGENRELLKKLQDAYHELIALKTVKDQHEDQNDDQDDDQDVKNETINFFSSHLPNLHFLYNKNSPSKSYIDKLQTLSSLKENGLLTESEFHTFKGHLLKMLNFEG